MDLNTRFEMYSKCSHQGPLGSEWKKGLLGRLMQSLRYGNHFWYRSYKHCTKTKKKRLTFRLLTASWF